MAISKEEIIRIAKLADLNLTQEEVETYSNNMNEIIEFVNMINSVDTTTAKETIGANAKYNVFRKDEVKEFKDTEKLLQNALSKEDGMFNIPKVINN